MREVTLKDIYEHPITQKYVRRSGMGHAISVSYHAFHLAEEFNVNPDRAAKAGFLHDIGHYEWYRDGKWDYQLYRDFDIHPIKGAERAHKLLVRLGEDKQAAKEISHAILFHTESAIPDGNFELKSLQKVVHLADEKDKQPGDSHHYRNIDRQKEVELIEKLDQKIDKT
ncbi:HD domain-containing protein [Virgibacillus necropolis]|uniref:Phosphohydrolase n=1 Tax=Virgibacillus necropolis TaxID=163877 RepID=A0A221MD92_9BACI|nr:HD domain-containing protein [Virgibacillus necropolis]ASN05580.1 phosphohydrolase [Virgibacillus necropolis]